MRIFSTGKQQAFVLVIFLLLATGLAAETQEFRFDLSGESDRHLRVHMIGGAVTIKGVDGDEVKVIADFQDVSELTDFRDEDGMVLLPNGGQNLEVRQNQGEVIVRAGTMDRFANLVIQIPSSMRVSVSSTGEGLTKLESVSGEMEIQSAVGPVEVTGIRNTAAIHAQADNVLASVVANELPGPLVISSWAGDVDVVINDQLPANLRWRTQHGEVRTNLSVENINTVTEREELDEGTRLEGYTVGTLNGGGPEISVSSYTGDITLKREGS